MPVKKSKSTKTASKSSTPRKKAATSPRRATSKKSNALAAGDCEVTIDRRTGADRRNPEQPQAPKKLDRRKKVQRRRQIDPTTCERDYSEQEVEFMNAMDRYKRISGRMFPTCSEVLEVIRSLGYVQLTAAEQAARGAEHNSADATTDMQPEELPADEFTYEDALL